MLLWLVIFLIICLASLIGYIAWKKTNNDKVIKKTNYVNCFKDYSRYIKFTLNLYCNYPKKKEKIIVNELVDKIGKFRANLAAEKGIVIPNVKICCSNEEENTYELYFENNLISKGLIYTEKLIIPEDEAKILFKEIPPASFTFIAPDATKHYYIDTKFIKSIIRKEKKSLKDISSKDSYDIILDEIKNCCYENIDKIIDTKYLCLYFYNNYADSFPIHALPALDLPYVNRNGTWHNLVFNDLRYLIINLAKNGISIANKDYIIQHLLDCLSRYDYVQSSNIDNVAKDLISRLIPEQANVFYD